MNWKFWRKEPVKEKEKTIKVEEPKGSFLLATTLNELGLFSVERVHQSDDTYFTEITIRSTADPTKIGKHKFYVSYQQHENCIAKIQTDTTIKCIVVPGAL